MYHIFSNHPHFIVFSTRDQIVNDKRKHSSLLSFLCNDVSGIIIIIIILTCRSKKGTFTYLGTDMEYHHFFWSWNWRPFAIQLRKGHFFLFCVSHCWPSYRWTKYKSSTKDHVTWTNFFSFCIPSCHCQCLPLTKGTEETVFSKHHCKIVIIKETSIILLNIYGFLIEIIVVIITVNFGYQNI